MDQQRRHFTAEQKVAVLREHFLDKVPVSNVCEKQTLLADLHRCEHVSS